MSKALNIAWKRVTNSDNDVMAMDAEHVALEDLYRDADSSVGD